jgi:uncharacterized small protein (DUF1192 family)
MIFDDDTEPKTKKRTLRPLDKLSLDELREYQEELQAEILRVEAEATRKKAHMQSMDALFKKAD